MDSKQAKAEANRLKAEEIRQKAMESFGQTKAREGQEDAQRKIEEESMTLYISYEKNWRKSSK